MAGCLLKKPAWTGTCAGIALLMILQGELVNSYSGGSIDRMQWSKSSSSQKTTYVYTAYIRMVIRVVSLLHFALLKYYIKACYVENFQHIYFFQKQNQSNFCCPVIMSQISNYFGKYVCLYPLNVSTYTNLRK